MKEAVRMDEACERLRDGRFIGIDLVADRVLAMRVVEDVRDPNGMLDMEHRRIRRGFWQFFVLNSLGEVFSPHTELFQLNSLLQGSKNSWRLGTEFVESPLSRRLPHMTFPQRHFPGFTIHNDPYVSGTHPTRYTSSPASPSSWTKYLALPASP